MSNRISSDDSISEEIKEEEPQRKIITFPEYPKDYSNPFDDDPTNFAPDNRPFVFTDIDFILKQTPRFYKGFEKIIITKEDRNTASKSQVERLWQYDRWRLWKIYSEMEQETVIVNLGETENPDYRFTVQINSVTWYIYKNFEVLVPKEIKNRILISQRQTSMANRAPSLLEYLSKQIDPQTGLPKDRTRLDR